MLRTVSVRRVNSAKVTFQVEFGFSCTIIFFQDRLVIWHLGHCDKDHIL